MGKRCRLPNGYGSVYKLSGKRRRPFAVAITTGWDKYGKQIKEIIGYAVSREEGLDILGEYRRDPYDLKFKNTTFTDIWKNVEIKLEKLVETNKMSESNLKGLRNAFKNHLQPLHNENILSIKKKQMQDIIDNVDGGVTLKGNAKTVCVKVFNYAIDELELPLKNNPAIRLDVGSKVKSKKHKPFTDEEIAILWGLQHNDIVKILLICCYGGERPNEVFTAEIENIFIEENYFISGSKTEAGRDRIIPIHPKVKHLITYFISKGGKYPFKNIFENFSYSKFSRETAKLMKQIGFEHTPYDGRHHFITAMKKAGANDIILKIIVGHSVKNDVTEYNYTHREKQELINEVRRIK